MHTMLQTRPDGRVRAMIGTHSTSGMRLGQALNTVNKHGRLAAALDHYYRLADASGEVAYSFSSVFKSIGSVVKKGIKVAKPFAPMLATAIPIIGPVAGPLLTMAAQAKEQAAAAKAAASSALGPAGSLISAAPARVWAPPKKKKKKKKSSVDVPGPEGELPASSAWNDPATVSGGGSLSPSPSQATMITPLSDPSSSTLLGLSSEELGSEWGEGEEEEGEEAYPLELAEEINASEGPGEAFASLVEEDPNAEELLDALSILADGRVIPSKMKDQLHFGETCDLCDGILSPDFSGRLPSGTFYRSNLITASLSQGLGRNVYGQVTLSDMPFPISINSQVGSGRARIALAHELAHVANKVYKLQLPHGQVHDLGVFYATEGFPALVNFEWQTAQADLSESQRQLGESAKRMVLARDSHFRN